MLGSLDCKPCRRCHSSPSVVTQEFHLSVTSLGSDRYLIRTEDTAIGVPIAEAQVEWSVDDWLQLAQPAMDDPVLGLLQGNAKLDTPASGLTRLGETLYDALFHEGNIRESWLRAQGIAQNRHEILRLRLGLKDSRLQRLPWEVLHQNGTLITTRADLTFARYAANALIGQSSDAVSLPDTEKPIQVLMVVASPGDQDHLQLLQEVRNIQALLAEANGTTLPLEVKVLDQPDRTALAQALDHGNYQVFHYAGHSDLGESGGDLSLVNRQTGLTERLAGDDLAGLLVNNQVALAVFNSCRSGHTAGDDADMDWRQQNLVQALISRGVPSVIAMAERIPDAVAIAFTQLFYNNLRQGFPIDLSLSRTRQGLRTSFGADQHYWALPILYLQPDFDGYLTKRDREADTRLDPKGLTAPEAVPLPESFPSDDASSPAAADAVSTEETATATLITQLETPHDSEPEEADVANFVKQLSQPSTVAEEPPMPAAEEEQLVTGQNERASMDIYEALPEVPIQSQDRAATLADTPVITPENRQRSPGAKSHVRRPQVARSSEQSILIWFALGLVGIFGVMGLGALSLRWAGVWPTDPPVSEPNNPAPPPTAAADVEGWIEQAQAAIAAEQYAEARYNLEQALTLELAGQVDSGAAVRAAWPLVEDARNSHLLYVRGRIYWQQLAAQTGDATLNFDPEYQTDKLIDQALSSWQLTEDDFVPGLVARGFAHFRQGRPDLAVEAWEAALALEDPLNPAAEPLLLHARAGLVMGYTQLADINLAAIANDDEGIGDASAEAQATLQEDSNAAAAQARERFLNLQRLDTENRLNPSNLDEIAVEEPSTAQNWLWTLPLINEWQNAYLYWDVETNETGASRNPPETSAE